MFEQSAMQWCAVQTLFEQFVLVWQCSNTSNSVWTSLLRPVLLAGRDGEQRRFGGQGDLDYSALRVRWLRTPLRGEAEAQGTRPSKPEKKGMRPIGNSRGIAVRVGRLLVGFGKGVGHLPVSVT